MWLNMRLFVLVTMLFLPYYRYVAYAGVKEFKIHNNCFNLRFYGRHYLPHVIESDTLSWFQYFQVSTELYPNYFSGWK